MTDPFAPLSAKPASPAERKRLDALAGASLGGKRHRGRAQREKADPHSWTRQQAASLKHKRKVARDAARLSQP